MLFFGQLLEIMLVSNGIEISAIPVAAGTNQETLKNFFIANYRSFLVKNNTA